MWTFVLFVSSLVVCIEAQTAEQLAAVDTTKATVQQQILELVNECRRTVQPTGNNLLKVTWSPEAAKTAEAWAKKCTFDHSPDSAKKITNFECGENLYKTSYYTTWKEAIDAFCNERNNFVYGTGASPAGSLFLHFTQLAWYNSHLLGCYVAYCPSGSQFKWFFVCHQCGKGNINDPTKPYTQGPSCGACPNYCENRLCTNSCMSGNNATNCDMYKGMCSYPQVQTACKGMCACPNAIV